MHHIFKVSASHIQSLNDTQARELVATLCKAELTSQCIGTHPVTWGGDQRAKDGGVDVRVEIFPAKGIEGYIPKDSSAYQVKAERFSGAKIPKEMAPKGILRNAIVDLAKQSGAYIIVSTRDSLSDSSLLERKKAMSDCISAHGLAGKVHLDFYDSRKIADWVGNHPSIATWVRQESGRPLDGWKSYGSWTHHGQSAQDEYLVDDKMKIFIPDSHEGVDVTKAINRMRSEIGLDRQSVRVTGLSGVGKTRFVQALFDEQVITLSCAPNQENVLYADLADNPTPQPIAMLEALISMGSDSVVVIDNCGQEIHQKLAEIVKRVSSKLRLITIEYDIRDDLPEGTSCYRLEGSSNKIISELLKRHYQTLSHLDIEKISEFSDGNARVAFALASTSKTKNQLAKLDDNNLFQRLFVQKNSTDNELLRCAEAASLLYSFNAEEFTSESEAALISSIAETTTISFLRNIVELKQRGLVQARGAWRAILPHAIANRLAYAALETYPTQWLSDKFVFQESDRIAISFSRRIGYLHESMKAQLMTELWLKPGGFLSDLPNLNEVQRKIFKNIAPVNQQATLRTLLRAVDNDGFVAISNPNRNYFAEIIRSLAYEADLFDQAAVALTKFSILEPESYRNHPATDTLKSLFYVHLSGTHASPQQRMEFVKGLALSGEKSKEGLAVALISAALQTDHFSCRYSFDFGARKRNYGWSPQTDSDIKNWFSLFINLVVVIAELSTPIGTKVLQILGASFRGLWTQAKMLEALTAAATKITSLGTWPDGWVGIKNTLTLDKNKIDDESLKKLKLLERELAPRDLLSEIHVRVLSRGSFSDDIDEEHNENRYKKSLEKAEELGRKAAHDEHALNNLNPYVLERNCTDKLWNFGYGIGQENLSMPDFLNRIRAIAKDLNTGDLNTIFIRGLITGWKKTHASELSSFLDNAVTDEVWSTIFPELQVNAGLDEIAVKRLILSLTLGKAPAWQFSYLSTGRATDPLSIEQASSLLSLIARMPDDGLAIASEILYMIIHCTDKKDEKYKLDLRVFCLKFMQENSWIHTEIHKTIFSHSLIDIINFSLADSNLHSKAPAVLEHLIQTERSSENPYPRRLGDLLLPFFCKIPLIALNYCYLPDDDGSYDTALRIVSNAHDDIADTAISGVDEDTLLDWCNSSPLDKYAFAARTCILFEKIDPNTTEGPLNLKISSTAVKILKFSSNKKQILHILLDRFHPNHYSGLLSTILHQRVKMLDQLNPDDDDKLRQTIDEAKIYFSNIISAEETREQSWERSRTGSFE